MTTKRRFSVANALREGFASAFDIGLGGAIEEIERAGRSKGLQGDAEKLGGDWHRVGADLLQAAKKARTAV